jgi:HAMP domain-containing protein
VVLGWWPRYTLPVAVLLALGVTQLLAHGMTSPLRELTAAARAMARGEHGRRVTATSRDEVGEAARAFNRMAEELEQVDRSRRELVANVSHELRTPVAALQAVLENVVDGVTPADPATCAPPRAGRAARHAGPELLDLSRSTPVRCRSHCSGCRSPARRGCGRRGAARRPRVTYDVRVDPADATVLADPARLHQVVANLLDNASRTARRRASSPCGASSGTAARGCPWATRDRGSRRRSASACSSASREVGRPPRTTAAPGWGSPSPGGRWTCTAAASPSRTPTPHRRLPHRRRAPRGDRVTTTSSAPPEPAPALRRGWPDPAVPVAAGTLGAAVAAGGGGGRRRRRRPGGGGAGRRRCAGGRRGRRPAPSRLDAGGARAGRPRPDPAALVAAVRDAEWLVALCVLAAAGPRRAVGLRCRSWTATLLTPAAVPVAALRALPWVARGARQRPAASAGGSPSCARPS